MTLDALSRYVEQNDQEMMRTAIQNALIKDPWNFSWNPYVKNAALLCIKLKRMECLKLLHQCYTNHPRKFNEGLVKCGIGSHELERAEDYLEYAKKCKNRQAIRYLTKNKIGINPCATSAPSNLR